MHSYGGLPGSEACKGLLCGDVTGKGGSGGAKALVYVSAMALLAGIGFPEDVKTNSDFTIDVSSPDPLSLPNLRASAKNAASSP